MYTTNESNKGKDPWKRKDIDIYHPPTFCLFVRHVMVEYDTTRKNCRTQTGKKEFGPHNSFFYIHNCIVFLIQPSI